MASIINFAGLCLLFTVCGFLSLSNAETNIQKPGLSQSPEDKIRAQDVKNTMSAAFKDYMQHGFPADEVRPISLGKRNTRNGWSASLVDSLTTLYVMDLQTEFKEAVDKTLRIDFSKSQTEDPISLFETTIRYLAAMLSAYELSGATNQELLKKAQSLGDSLTTAWQTNQQQLPFPQLNFSAGKPVNIDVISAAAAGTLMIEFDRLSFYTKDNKYIKLAQKSQRTVMNAPSTLPGIPGLVFSVQNGSVVNDLASWGGGVDSYTEYLLKYGMLIENSDPTYIDAWKLAVKSSIENLIQVSSTGNLTYLADYSKSSNGLKYQFSHLACFAGGNWLLGAKVLQDPKIFDFGLKLVETCAESYRRTKTGIGAEIFQFLSPLGQNTDDRPPSQEQLAFLQKNGFYNSNSQYILRPEVIESAFHAWRITGDRKYQDFVWAAYQSILKYCKGTVAFAAIDSVEKEKPERLDEAESFLFVFFPYHFKLMSLICISLKAAQKLKALQKP
ncbi:glycoside hydrolase [Phakopsora pachyrhizi]|nr:glycoside hydrolase [Phakopsora pachyrhizi]